MSVKSGITVSQMLKISKKIGVKLLKFFRTFFFYINYIIHCKIKKDNHQVPKIIRVPGNKRNPKKIK